MLQDQLSKESSKGLEEIGEPVPKRPAGLSFLDQIKAGKQSKAPVAGNMGSFLDAIKMRKKEA